MNIEELRQKVESGISSITTVEDLKGLKLTLLGRKGVFAEYLEGMRSLDKEERKTFGKEINMLKAAAEARLGELEEKFALEEKEKEQARSWIDITMPGKRPVVGRKHPITQTFDEIIRIFSSLGFSVAEGPNIETEHYNFESLNIPADHPARDMQDTFYVKPGVVLRTHTSPMQVRVMESQLPPVRIISPGSVYRCDQDVSHTPMFHQVEGLMVDKGVRFSDLKGILTVFIHEMFGANTPVRFRPSYFPFTEPSFEFDISCTVCGGSGCSACRNAGWLEIGGAGMVNQFVFESVGYKRNQYQGFAWGFGIERLAMMKYKIDDIRLMHSGDLRFINQF